MNRSKSATISDAPLVASWILEDAQLLKHLPVGTEKEALDFSKNLCELGAKDNALLYEKDSKLVAIAALFATDYIKLKLFL